MSLFSKMFGHADTHENEARAEEFIREQTALYRHYHLDEVQLCVTQFTGVNLSPEQAVQIVQRVRNEKGLGPIAEYNLPGYVEEEG